MPASTGATGATGPSNELFGSASGNTNIGDSFYGLFDSGTKYTTAAAAGTPMHRAGTFKNLRAKANANTTATITVVKNGTATAITCTMTAAASCVDTTNSVAFAAGDSVSIQASGTAGAKPIFWTIEYAP